LSCGATSWSSISDAHVLDRREERVRFSGRWGATIFGGVGWLYGTGEELINSDGYYPSYGAGVHFIVKPEDHMLLNLEYTRGNLNNYGIYLRFGYAW